MNNIAEILWMSCYIVAVAGLSAYGIHRFWMIWTYLQHKKNPILPVEKWKKLPSITVQLPIFNEYYVAERLIRSVAELDYPRELLEIQVLDDSTDETVDLVAQTVEEYRKKGFDIVHLHRENRTGFKAGALEEGMKKAKGEFLAIFDADFLPPPQLLKKTVHYFCDPAIGLVQTRWGHLNRSYNLLTRVQALLLDGHLLIEQTARNRSGRFFNFNGTAGIWRKSCIEEAGGWHHDTLTEDLDLSYRAQIQGWRFVFVPELISPAELPVEMNAFKAQQHRWAKGAIQTCKKLLPIVLKKELPFRVKFEACFHLTSNFAYLLLALLAILMLLMHPNPQDSGFHWQSILTIDLPIFVMASLSIFVFYGTVLHELKYPWYKILFYLPVLIAVGVGLSMNNAKAVLEAVFNHQSEFTRTPKYGFAKAFGSFRNKKYFSVRSLLPFFELLLSVGYAYLVWVAWNYELWVSLPFFVLFFIGFGYSGILSVLHGSFFSPNRNSASV